MYTLPYTYMYTIHYLHICIQFLIYIPFPIYIYVYHYLSICIPFLIYMYTIPYLYDYVHHSLSICTPFLIYMYTIPYLYVICIPFLIRMYSIPYPYVYHFLSMCIPFLIYMYTIPYQYVYDSLSILLLINIYPSLSICINILPITPFPFFCSLFGSESKWYTEQTSGVLKGLENIIKRANRDICKKSYNEFNFHVLCGKYNVLG